MTGEIRSFLRPCNEKYGKYDLNGQNHRHADVKFGVLCFVPEQLHPGVDAKAAAQNCHGKHGLFRDAPAVFDGFSFIN